MSATTRWHYYRRIFSAYLGSGRSQLTFWHEVPEMNPRATARRLGEYYMLFRGKVDYAGHYDAAGIPMLDYRGVIGLQYNPIAIAQWGLANYNRFCESGDQARWQKTLLAADWLTANLEQNAHGLWVWNHHFDWEYRDTLKAPWYSGLFPARLRYSGASPGFQIGAAVSGGLTPLIAASLLAWSGGSIQVGAGHGGIRQGQQNAALDHGVNVSKKITLGFHRRGR